MPPSPWVVPWDLDLAGQTEMLKVRCAGIWWRNCSSLDDHCIAQNREGRLMMYSWNRETDLANLNRQAVSVAEQSLGCRHSGEKAMVAIPAYMISIHTEEGGFASRFPLGLRLGSSRSCIQVNNTQSLRSSHTQGSPHSPDMLNSVWEGNLFYKLKQNCWC